jgi:hypothetical protein
MEWREWWVSNWLGDQWLGEGGYVILENGTFEQLGF